MKHIRAFVKSSLQLDNGLTHRELEILGPLIAGQHNAQADVEMQRRFHTTRGEPFSEQNLQRGL